MLRVSHPREEHRVRPMLPSQRLPDVRGASSRVSDLQTIRRPIPAHLPVVKRRIVVFTMLYMLLQMRALWVENLN